MSSPFSDSRSLVVPAIVGAVGASAVVGALAYNRQGAPAATAAPRKVKPVSGSSVSYRCKIVSCGTFSSFSALLTVLL